MKVKFRISKRYLILIVAINSIRFLQYFQFLIDIRLGNIYFQIPIRT